MEDQNLLTQPMERPQAKKCCGGGCGCQQTGPGVSNWLGVGLLVVIGAGTLLGLAMALGIV